MLRGLYFHVCVCGMCACVYTSVHTYEHTWKPLKEVDHPALSLSSFNFLRQGLSSGLELDWPSARPNHPPVSAPCSAGVTAAAILSYQVRGSYGSGPPACTVAPTEPPRLPLSIVNNWDLYILMLLAMHSLPKQKVYLHGLSQTLGLTMTSMLSFAATSWCPERYCFSCLHLHHFTCSIWSQWLKDGH